MNGLPAQRPELAVLVRWLGEDAADLMIDPDVAVELTVREVVSGDAPGALDRLLDQLAWAVEAGPADDDAFAGWLGMNAPAPGGRDRRAWLRYARRYAATFRPATTVPVLTGELGLPPLPRRSRFHDADTANRCAAEVLQVHEGRFRAWVDDPGGTRRLHLVADLGRPIGVLLGEPGSAPGAPGSPASACAVVLMLDAATGRPFVAACYPERDLPSGPRAAFPDLAQFFGAYFCQDYRSLDAGTWGCEEHFNGSVAAPVRRRVADQLALLPAEDDAGLRAAVEALGCYALPHDLRRWVSGLRRRMLWLEWQDGDPLEPEG